MTVSEAGKKGGTKTAEGHGEKFYTKIGREGLAARERNKKLGSNGTKRNLR